MWEGGAFVFVLADELIANMSVAFSALCAGVGGEIVPALGVSFCALDAGDAESVARAFLAGTDGALAVCVASSIA